jgi:uncharacterized GH25 family protein
MTVLRSLVALCILATPLQAHEFWIEAEDFTVAPGGTVTATFRNGEEMSGSALSYVPRRSERLDYIADGPVAPIPAQVGDNPAIVMEDLPEGLVTLIHETAEQTVTYTEWAKWVRFTEHKDFAWGQQAQLERGLPREGFREAYLRFAKALVAVGDGRGADAWRGMRVEFVAEANPYVDDLSDGLPVQLLFEGEPKADAQIEMFARDSSRAVEVTLHRTDSDGRAILPLRPGVTYLLDSVTLLPIESQSDSDSAWLTLWAALTFAVPTD